VRFLVLILLSIMMPSQPLEFSAKGGGGLSISGRVVGLEGNDHVLVRAVCGSQVFSVTTRAAGWWKLENLRQGEYIIQPLNARYRFRPEKLRIRLGKRPVSDVEFRAEHGRSSE